MGPFIGKKSGSVPVRLGLIFCVSGLVVSESLGLPRSHARLSKSPKTWHELHDASPLLDVVVAS
jgi:hypothetical protein